mgnify:CR=1 FL=1
MEKLSSIEAVVQRYFDEHISYRVIDDKRPRIAWDRMRPHFSHISVKELNGKHVNSYAKKRRVSAGTINRELGVLSAALRYAYQQAYIDRLILIPMLPSPQPRQRWLTKNDCLRLLEASKKYRHIFAFIGMAMLTGQRKEAILGLTKDRICWEDGFIDFNEPGPLSERKKGRAVVPISNDMKLFLEEIEDDSIFVVNNNGRRIRDMRTAWKKVLEDAGLEGVTPHTLRHSVATQLVRDRVPMIEVSKLLGHRDSRTTEKVYTKFDPDFLNNATSRLTLYA